MRSGSIGSMRPKASGERPPMAPFFKPVEVKGGAQGVEGDTGRVWWAAPEWRSVRASSMTRWSFPAALP